MYIIMHICARQEASLGTTEDMDEVAVARRTPEREAITLRHLLSMTTGMACRDELATARAPCPGEASGPKPRSGHRPGVGPTMARPAPLTRGAVRAVAGALGHNDQRVSGVR